LLGGIKYLPYLTRGLVLEMEGKKIKHICKRAWVFKFVIGLPDLIHFFLCGFEQR